MKQIVSQTFVYELCSFLESHIKDVIKSMAWVFILASRKVTLDDRFIIYLL